MRGDGADEGEARHARMDGRAGKGAVNYEVIAARGAQAICAVDPCGGNAHDGQQGKEPEVRLALFGNEVE